MARRASALALALALLGCEGTPAQLIVVVATDYAPGELTCVGITVTDGDDPSLTSERRVVVAAAGPGEMRVELPFSFGVLPHGGEARRAVKIRVDGYGSGGSACPADGDPDAAARVRVSRVARTGFQRGARLRLPIFLARACEELWRTCEGGRQTCVVTCDGGGCTPASCLDPLVSSGSLEPVRPGRELVNPRDAGTGTIEALEAYIKASNTGTDYAFGYSVALSADGNTLAVGSFSEDGDGPNSGAVYLFRRTGELWSQEAYIKASNTGAHDTFGHDVALSADGSTLAVGAPREDSAATGVDGDQGDDSATESGAVYVFRRRDWAWMQEAYVKGSNAQAGDQFGWSVALSADGSTLAVGAPLEDSAATGVGGDAADNGALDSGAVYLLRRSGATWRHDAYIKADNAEVGDEFGQSVAVSADGSTLAVGAPLEDSDATGVGGAGGDNAAMESGAVYVFRWASTRWMQEAYVKASNTDADDQFGMCLALSEHGDTLAVGAPVEASAASGVGGDQDDDSLVRSGAVYVFRRTDTVWSQEVYLKASNTGELDNFGFRLALSADGGTLAVAAPLEDSGAIGVGGDAFDESAPGSGAVYLFRRHPTWREAVYVKASNTGPSDHLEAVTLSRDGSVLVVGAWMEDSDATGIGGDSSNDRASNSGAVYVYR